MKKLRIFAVTMACLFDVSCVPTVEGTRIASPNAVPDVSTSMPQPAGALETPTLTATPAVTSSLAPGVSPTATVYTDVWVSGYVYGNQMQVGNASSHVPVIDGFDISIQAADERVVAQLAALLPGDVLVVLEGDLTLAPSARTGHLLVKSVRLVNLPYAPDTPLDATYTHPEPVFRIDYPAGWFVEVYDDHDLVLITNAPPEAASLRPGREHLDPTEVDIGIHSTDARSIEDYLANIDHLGQETIEIGGRAFIRIEIATQGTIYQYVTLLGGRVVIFGVYDYNVAFVERMLATLR